MSDFFLDNGALIKDLALIVLMIVAIGCTLEAFRVWIAHREKMATAIGERATQEAERQSIRNEQIERRVAVLERLAIDRGADLSLAIDRLRDDHLN